MASDKAIGMMDAGFFVGRTELLNWLNDLLKLGYTKVEQVCTGAAHCQILDSCFPGRIPLHKVNFTARLEYEYVKNYKILQDAFNRLGIQKYIEVEKLIKGRYQDNLEFLQWMKRYWDLHRNQSGPEYNAVAERQRGPAGYNPGTRAGAAVADPGATATTTAPVAHHAAGAAPGRIPGAPHLITTTGAALIQQQQHPQPVAARGHQPGGMVTSGSLLHGHPAPQPQTITVVDPQLKQRNEELAKRVAELESVVDSLEKVGLPSPSPHPLRLLSFSMLSFGLIVGTWSQERDWYFAKLRDVEVICQKHQGEPALSEIEKVLYATEEDAAGAGGEEAAAGTAIETAPADSGAPVNADPVSGGAPAALQ
ncbi:putative Microtubule-associated protein RP/EB family member 1C [Paratrimastix pyriformis]|uniref:Microtubule-associated protein RP/EB family member 1C n=1 Tax=Paratrimastix pyriformis TaxID=342808 RepID=A0ABQ8USN1_9EUKA|nr:putative Microtubule-associated protein RP/EB family member 1C [Paratrimastix pyriformis]